MSRKHAFAWVTETGIRMEFSEEVKTSLRMNSRRYALLAEALRKIADELEKRCPKVTLNTTPKNIVDRPC